MEGFVGGGAEVLEVFFQQGMGICGVERGHGEFVTFFVFDGSRACGMARNLHGHAFGFVGREYDGVGEFSFRFGLEADFQRVLAVGEHRGR